MTQPPSESIAVVDVPDRGRFEISVDDTMAGFTTYTDAAGPGDCLVERTFPHTVIEEEFGGRGLATILIRTALDAARVAGLTVDPQCSVVQHVITKHPDYLDLVPEPLRAELAP